MKAFMMWLVLQSTMMAGAYAMVRNIDEQAPAQKIGVAVDASFAMREDWGHVPRMLDDIARAHPKATFIVVTEPGSTGEWAQRPSLDGARPFAPRRLEKLAAMPLWGQADTVYLITNDRAFDAPSGWRTRHPGE